MQNIQNKHLNFLSSINTILFFIFKTILRLNLILFLKLLEF